MSKLSYYFYFSLASQVILVYI